MANLFLERCLKAVDGKKPPLQIVNTSKRGRFTNHELQD